MKLPRVSLVSIEFVIVVLAVNFGVMRALYDSVPGSLTDGGWALAGFLLLPMIDLLLIGLFRLRRRDRRTPRAIGILIVGSAASLAVFTSCVVAPETMYDALRAIGSPIARGTVNGMTRYLGNAAIQSAMMQLTLGIAFEVLFPMAFFCLPPLLAALSGGWLAHRLSNRWWGVTWLQDGDAGSMDEMAASGR
jgi:hypothetical protein